MPKKACCCEVKDGSVWVAIPCRYYGKIVFDGYSKGFTGFSPEIKSQVQNIFNADHGIFGTSGPYKGYHPFYKFPDSAFPAVIVEGGPPIKVTGTGPCDPTNGDIAWGGWAGQDCYEYLYEVDQGRQVLYKAWGAGGGGVGENLPGGNGAYTQTQKNYSINDYASVGFGGFGNENVRISGSCYGTPGTDYTTVPGSNNFIATIPDFVKNTGVGGQGYNSWGGGAAYISSGNLNISNAHIIAGAGAGAGAYLTKGGNGGITHGGDAPGEYGGRGATNTIVGTKGSLSATDGQNSMGGRGAIPDPLFAPGSGVSGGGGGGGGWAGGGGGGTGHGGGGGSSKITTIGEMYSFSGTDLGPPNICDPDYFITMPDGSYSIPGLGGGFVVQATNQWAPDPIKSYYSLGYNGQSGKIVATYAALQCPCNDALSTIPDRSYICLSATQAKYICENINDCCEGITGSNITIEGNTGAGWSGNSGFTTTVCGYGANFGETGPIRPSGACAGRGETGGSAGSFGPGGGCGGFGLGSIYCPDISGFTGLSGSDSGIQFPNQTRSGELNTYVYKTFRYEGELYYLIGPCGVACSQEFMIPENAVFTDIACREWAACCEVIVGYPLCKATGPSDTNCWSVNNCPCTPNDNPEPFIVCENVDLYPNKLFWTRVGDWYYSAAKTTYWQLFGEPEIKKLSSIPIIEEDPCPPCTGGGFGNGDCTGDNQGGLGNNNGDPTEYNCCVDISEEQSDKPTPFAVNIESNFQFKGKGPYTIGSCVIPDSSCSCKKFDFTENYFSDSANTSISSADYCNLYYLLEPGYYESRKSFPTICDPNTGLPGCPPQEPFLSDLKELTYRLHFVGMYGSFLEERCYAPLQRSCPDGTTIFNIKNGLPIPGEDWSTIEDNYDKAFQLISTCSFDATVCTGDCVAFPEIQMAGPTNCGYVNCDGFNFPKPSGKTIVTNGCRLSKLKQAMQQIAASSQKFTFIDFDTPLDYWIGGPRSRFYNIPGDELVYIDTFDISVLDNTITYTCIRTYYCASPAFNIEVIFSSKPINACCGSNQTTRFIQSKCGNYDASGWAFPYSVNNNPTGDLYSSSTCPGIEPDSFLNCLEAYPPPVPTIKTLAQYEVDPSIVMLQDKAYGVVVGNSTSICQDRCDDFDLPASCVITSVI